MITLSQALRDRFKKIYIDDLNLYYDKKSTALNTDIRIHSLLKSKFLKVDERALFDQWLLEEYDSEDVTVCIEMWERKLQSNTKQNVFSRHLRMQTKGDELYFYKAIPKSNQLIKLCDTTQADYLTKIGKYFGNNLRNSFFMHATSTQIKKELIKALEADIIPSIGEIMNFTNDPTIPCLAHYDLTKLPDGPTPAWDSFLYTFNSVLYRELFMAWVYSIFVADNFGRQVLWIHGMGKSGKSTAIRTIFAYMRNINEELAQTIEKIQFEDKYSLAAYKNCRLGVIADGANRWLIKRETIKNLTGRDPTSVREMNKERESMELYCKIMCASNYPPFVLTEVEHEISRILYVKLDDDRIFEARDAWNVETDGDWNKLLFEELPSFIGKCKEFYHKHLSSDGQNFKIYPEMIKDLDAGLPDIKETVDVYWDLHFAQDDDAGYISTSWISDDFMRFLNGAGKNKISKIRSYIYVKIRNLKNSIDSVGVGRTEVIKGWRYLKDQATTLDKVVDARIAEMNADLKKKRKAK